MNNTFDLLSTVEYGGCSAKMPPGQLAELLGSIPLMKDKNILVDIETHDDAGVYKINDDLALIVTTDFFPPICSDAYEFGQIAAANSLSDVYAMGGKPLLVLNLTMFPSATIPAEVLRDEYLALLAGRRRLGLRSCKPHRVRPARGSADRPNLLGQYREIADLHAHGDLLRRCIRHLQAGL